MTHSLLTIENENSLLISASYVLIAIRQPIPKEQSLGTSVITIVAAGTSDNSRAILAALGYVAFTYT